MTERPIIDHLHSGEPHPEGPLDPQALARAGATPTDASRYPDSEWAPIDGKGGLSYRTLANPKVALHTTETSRLPNYSSPPHLTLDVSGAVQFGKVWQHVPLDLGAYALRSPGRPQSPNADAGPTLQVELIAFAEDTPTWSPDQYGVVADVCAWAVKNHDVAVRYPSAGFGGSERYGTGAPGRFQSFADLCAFTGILGHQHVWYNSHWDPGAVDLDQLDDAIQARLNPEPEPPPTPPKAVLVEQGDQGGDVQFWAAILNYRGQAIEPDHQVYDAVMVAAVKAELPNTAGKRITGRQGAMILNRLWRP